MCAMCDLTPWTPHHIVQRILPGLGKRLQRFARKQPDRIHFQPDPQHQAVDQFMDRRPRALPESRPAQQGFHAYLLP